MTFNIRALNVMTFNIMTFNIRTLSVMYLNVTVSINNTQLKRSMFVER
jgi:hypothetical protein